MLKAHSTQKIVFLRKRGRSKRYGWKGDGGRARSEAVVGLVHIVSTVVKLR